jgi:hypothetical protein
LVEILDLEVDNMATDWNTVIGRNPMVTVGPGTGADYTSLSAAINALGSGYVYLVDGAYTNSGTETISYGNLTIIFGNIMSSTTTIQTLKFDSTSRAIQSINIWGGQFNAVLFNGVGNNSISDIRFFGSEVSTGTSVGGITYSQGSGTGGYVQQIDWFGCRFDDQGGPNGYLHNVAGTPNASAGGYNTHGCKYIASGNPILNACFFYLPMGQLMGTDCTHEDLMFTNNNTASGVSTYALLVGPTTGGTGATNLMGFKFSHCYFECHGLTIGAYVAANSTSESVHLYVLFEEGTYNVAPNSNASWQMWNVNNTNWKPHASNGVSGLVTHYGHRVGPNPLTASVDTGNTADYQSGTLDDRYFLT